MCKAHSTITHIKQQKYYHHLKRRGKSKVKVKVWTLAIAPLT